MFQIYYSRYFDFCVCFYSVGGFSASNQHNPLQPAARAAATKQFYVSNVAKAGLGGALSGGVMAGGASAVGAARNAGEQTPKPAA